MARQPWRLCAALTLALVACAACRSDGPAPASTSLRGVKLYLNQENLQAHYPNYDTLVDELGAVGLNALFTTVYEGRTAFYQSAVLPKRDPAIDVAKLRDSARRKGMRFGAISHIFFDADTLAERPDLSPVDQHGDSSFVNWQKLICPSDRDYRQYKLSIVKEVAATLRPDVISLDFMRFPTTWEIIPPATAPDHIRNFCFCDRCLTGFQRQSSVTIPPALNTVPAKAQWILANHRAAWVAWKTGLITSFVEEASRAVRAIDPAIRISVHVVPWGQATFDNAAVWNAGQDPAALGAHVDYLSPMIYHKLIGHPVDNVGALTAELAAKSGRTVLPSIQAAQILTEGEVPAEEFRRSLALALQPPSGGTLIFQWEPLRPDAAAPPLRQHKRDILTAASR